MSQLKADDITDAAGTGAPTFSQGIDNQQVARAWINFNGATATAGVDLTGVNDSFGVISLVDNGVGDYSVNWDTVFANANYVCVGAMNNNAGDRNNQCDGIESLTVGAVNVTTNNQAGTYVDKTRITIIAFGDQ